MKIRRIVSVFLLAVLMSILCLPPLAYADEPLDIQAKAALLVDGSSGRVLYAKNEHEELYPASITKVTTALLVFEAIERGDLRLDQTVTVSASALAGQDPDGSTAGIKEGEQLTVEELLYCMLVVSANEACSILAEAVSGSVDAFIEQMNQRVQELGCVNTHYVNDSGLHDPQHYSSAWDIYLITREAMKYDEFMTIVNSKSYTVPATNLSEARELHSTNALISTWRMLGYYYSGAQGIKTGSTSDAGNCLVSSAVRGSRRLVGVVLGADTVTDAGGSRKVMSFVEMARMFDYGFDNFTSQTVLKSDEAVMEVPVALSKETNYVVVHPAEKLDALRPNIHVLEYENLHNYLVSGDISVAYTFTPFVALALDANPDLKVVWPEEGLGFGIDGCFIPVNAPHAKNANLLRPEVAATCVEYQYYCSPNEAAKACLSESYLNNPVFNGIYDRIDDAEYVRNLSSEDEQKYQDIWTTFKLSMQ